MAIKIMVDARCSVCEKKISLKGKKIQGRRMQFIYLPDVYVVEEPYDYAEYDIGVEIKRGYRVDRDDPEGEGLCCSVACAVKQAEKYTEKLKPFDFDKDRE